MEIQEYIAIGFFLLSVGITIANIVKGGPIDPLSLALKLVTDAEQLIEVKDGETWDQANKRKLRYALEKMREKYPDLDITMIENLIERAVDLLKNRVRIPVYSSLGDARSAETRGDTHSKLEQF